MFGMESISIKEPNCEHGSDCPCPVLELIDGKILFVGTPAVECTDSIAYEDGRVCTCVRRNQNLSAAE